MTSEVTIQAVVFDLGNVVIDIEPERICAHWARAIGADVEEVTRIFWEDRVYERLERGEIDLPEYHRHMAGQMVKSIPYEEFAEGWNRIYLGVTDGMDALLRRLKKSLRLVALTNTNGAHAECWRVLFAEVLRHFEEVFCSHEIASRKPEPRAYQLVLEYLKLPARQVVFVDDREENVLAARDLGMCGIVARDTTQIAEELEALGVETVSAG